MKSSLFVIFAIILTAGILYSCNSPKVKQPESVDFKKLSKKSTTIVVDVRTAEEFEAGHLEKSINIPLPVIADSIESLKKYENIILICRSGNRSGKAKVILEEHGLKNVYNGGGWEAFQDAIK